jgi:hypothetical protein
MPGWNAVVVTGAGFAAANGTYARGSAVNDRAGFVNGEYSVFWNGLQWRIERTGVELKYFSNSNEPFPWLVTWQTWAAGGGLDPVPTVTPARI